MITDPDARAKVDTALAAASAGGGRCRWPRPRRRSTTGWTATTRNALRRSELSARGRHVDVLADRRQRHVVDRGKLFGPDAEALDQRLDAMARAVCDADPRTLEQRRADALGALGHGGDRLACACGDPECEAAERRPVRRWCTSSPRNAVWPTTRRCSSTANTAAAGPDKPLREMTIAEALAPDPPTGPANANLRW